MENKKNFEYLNNKNKELYNFQLNRNKLLNKFLIVLECLMIFLILFKEINYAIGYLLIKLVVTITFVAFSCAFNYFFEKFFTSYLINKRNITEDNVMKKKKYFEKCKIKSQNFKHKFDKKLSKYELYLEKNKENFSGNTFLSKEKAYGNYEIIINTIFSVNLDLSEINEYLKQIDIYIKEQQKELEKISLIDESDKKNFEFMKQSINNLIEIKDSTIKYKNEISNIIQLSKELISYVEKNPMLFKKVMKIYNIYIKELSNIFDKLNNNIFNDILTEKENEKIHDNIISILNDLNELIKKSITEAKEQEKNSVDVSIKILKNEIEADLNKKNGGVNNA